MYWTHSSRMVFTEFLPMQLEFGGVEEHVERCPLFQIETAELLEAHDCKAGVNGVQLGYLDLSPIDVVRVVGQLRQPHVADLGALSVG